MLPKSLFTTLVQTLALTGAALLLVALPLRPTPEPLAPTATDLAITKTASPSPVLLGSRLTYSILVRNLSGQKATSVVMTDTLPANVTFASVSISKGTCTRTGSVVRCTLGNVNRNNRVTVTIAVTPTSIGILTNTASVATSTADSNLANNSTTVTTVVKSTADLAISKTGLPEPVYAGNPLNYTLVVTNVGPSDATQVVVTDTLPSSLSFGSASAGCAYLAGVVKCTLGTVPGGSTRALTLTVVPDSLLAGTIVNQAAVAGSEVDPVTANNTAFAVNTVIAVADLAVNQTSAPTLPLLGSLLTYTVTVTNNGPSAASGIVLTDTLPAGVTFSSASAGCSPAGGGAVCSFAAILAGGTATATIGVVPNAPGQITNTVSATGAQFDPNTANNTQSASTMIVPAADLAILKTSSGGVVLPGQIVTYTIAITNGGPSTATNVIMSDNLPASVSYGSASPSQGTCSGTSLVTCSLGVLNSGASAAVTLVVTPTIEGAVVNTATVTSAMADPNLANNASTVRIAVNPVDLSVGKTASAKLLNLAQPLTYTIVVTNNGPLSGTSVRLTDTLPANVTLKTFATSQGSCTGTSTIGCDLGGLNVGNIATVTVVVTSTTTGAAVNTAVASADEPDPNPADNVATATTLINSRDLSIKKTGAPNPAYVGSRLTYTLVVTNSGPLAATGVLVTDTLPAGVTYDSASNGCSQSNQQMTCSISSLLLGASQTITVAVTPDTATVGTITNTAVVSGDQPESNPADNTTTTSTRILPSANLDLTKIAESNPINAGDRLIYILTLVNHGPSAATGVVVTDTLPAEVALTGASAVCSGASDVVTCTVGTLPPGSIASLLIATTPTASAAGLITNTASVAAHEHDPGLANNTAQVTTTVIALSNLAVTKTAAPDPAQSGSLLIYTVRVTNTGPSNAMGVSVTDTLPAGVTFNAASVGCAQAPGGGTVTCALGALATGSNRVISITVTPQASTSGTTIDNTVEVASLWLDPDPSDNVFVLSTDVDPVDLAVVKTGAPDPVVIGKTLTYTLVVTNYGPTNATGVSLVDTLPSAVTFGAASSACINASGVVTCDLTNLATGSNRTVTITVVPTAADVITNTALVYSNEADNNPANDTATATTRVILNKIYLPLIWR